MRTTASASTRAASGQTKIGDQYRCSYAITNNQDEANDTLTITSLVDTVNRPGSPNSGNILQIPGIGSIVTFEQLPGNTTTNASCTGPRHAGRHLHPAGRHPHPDRRHRRRPRVQLLHGRRRRDFNVNPATHRLTDTAALTWQDLCTSGTNNCPEGDQSSQHRLVDARRQARPRRPPPTSTTRPTRRSPRSPPGRPSTTS